MDEPTAIVLEHLLLDDWAAITLGVTQRGLGLATARPGQFVALRCTGPGSHDPLTRRPLWIAASDPQAGRCTLLVARTDPAFAFVAAQARGTALDLLGPLGHGWTIDGAARMLALVGSAANAAPLFALAHGAVGRGLSVSMLLGQDQRLSAPAAFLLPAAAEYNVVTGADASEAALSMLDEQVLRWSDQLAVALPQAQLGAVGQRVRATRMQWTRGFAQAALLQPDEARLACCVGVCGVCTIETRQSTRLSCVDGPVFDLRDLVR